MNSNDVNPAAAIIDTCSEQGHIFAKLPEHPKRDGRPQCPNCLSIGLERERAMTAELRDTVRKLEARLAELAQPEQEPVGVVGKVPGTRAFTMAGFKADDVPVGTKLYRHPQPAQQPAQQPEAQQDAETIAQTFTGLPKRKLRELLLAGWQVNGVSFQRTEDDGTVRRGAVTTGGMVLWWNQTPQQPVTSLQCANCQVTIDSLNDKVMRLMEQRKPLTDERIQDLLGAGDPTEEECRLLRLGWNAAHGITGEKK